MRILFFSDLHAYKFSNNASVINGVHSRLHYSVGVLLQIIKYALDNEIKEICFGGDLYHTKLRLDVEIQEMIYNIFDRYKGILNFHFISGNHDIGNSLYSALTPLKGIGKVYLEPTTITLRDGTTIAMIPYQYSEEALKRAMYEHPAEIMLGHTGIIGAKVNGKEMKEGCIDLKTIKSYGYKKIFLGHWHDPNAIIDPVVKYIGAAIHTASDDRGDRGFLVYDTIAHTYEHVNTAFPKFMLLHDKDLIGVSTQDLEVMCTENYVKIITENAKQYIKLIENTSVTVIEDKPIPKVAQRLDISVQDSDEVTFRKYIEKYYPGFNVGDMDRVHQLALKIKSRSEE